MSDNMDCTDSIDNMDNMTKTVKVRVPGTSANCGPGFDCLGVACTIYNELEMTLLREDRLDIVVTGDGAEEIPLDSRNIVWQAAKLLLARVGKDKEYKGAVIRMHNGVPMSRGLGSSATAIVGGLKAANACLGEPCSKDDLLQMATDIEGHPDNVAPAIFGGFTVSIVQEGKPQCFALQPKLPLKLVVVVPDFHLPTKEARAVLPKSLTRQDAVFNISRAAMLMAALCEGRAEYLQGVFDDALHQPYRAKLIPGMYEAFQGAVAAGALGACLSGAGPCLMAFTMENMEAVGQAMVQVLSDHGVKAVYHVLDIDSQGAAVL